MRTRTTSLSNLLLTIAILALIPTSAFAWPACSGNWIQVPAGTSTANGAIVTENGQTFQCQKPAPTPTPAPTSITSTNTNTNQNTNTNNLSNQQSQGQNQGQSQGQGQSQTANGGNATATGGNSSSKSSVANSGNSSNTNNNTANGGAGGQGGQGGTGGNAQQSQSNASTNNNQANGNGSNSNNTTNNVEAPKIPVATAYAPSSLPTVQCFKGTSVGAQSAAFGFSFGGGRIDDNCARLEVARSFDLAGERLAACKVKVSNKYAKEAGVTLEDCMLQQTVAAPPAPVTVAPTPGPQVFILPMAQPQPQPVVNTPVSPFLGYVTNVNNVTKARLDDIVLLAKRDPNGFLRLRVGPSSLPIADNIRAYIVASGIDGSRIDLRDDGDNHGVEMLWIVQ